MKKRVAMLLVAVVAFSAGAEQAGTNAVPGTTNGATVIPAGSLMTNGPAASSPAAVTNALPGTPDPMVGKVLLALASHMRGARRFRCDVSFLFNSEMEGVKQEISTHYALAIEKPNRLSLRYLKGMPGNTVVCNGKTILTYAPSLNRYEEKEAPKTFEQFSQGVGPMSGNMLFVDNLLREDVYAAIMDGVVKATYAGKETVDGVECDHLKFVQDQFDWDMWVTPGLAPVVVQVLSDMSKAMGTLTEEGGAPRGVKMTVLNRFSNWAVDGVLATNAFEFKPPAGARKTESLFDREDEEAATPPVVTLPEADKATNVVERK